MPPGFNPRLPRSQAPKDEAADSAHRGPGHGPGGRALLSVSGSEAEEKTRPEAEGGEIRREEKEPQSSGCKRTPGADSLHGEWCTLGKPDCDVTQECGVSCASAEGMKRHMIKHEEEPRFKCSFCAKSFWRKVGSEAAASYLIYYYYFFYFYNFYIYFFYCFSFLYIFILIIF